MLYITSKREAWNKLSFVKLLCYLPFIFPRLPRWWGGRQRQAKWVRAMESRNKQAPHLALFSLVGTRTQNVTPVKVRGANVTLDPDTAHPILILSEDGKSVRWGDKPQALPDNPERFRHRPCVLGREGFTEGSHFWEVTVGSEEEWALGVTRKSVERKDYFNFSPEWGIWAVGKRGEKYWASTSPADSPLSLNEEPRRIRVTLDYEGGRVSFSDADSGAELYTFSGASFSGETLLPLFDLWGNEAHLSPAEVSLQTRVTDVKTIYPPRAGWAVFQGPFERIHSSQNQQK
uniref:B30.2/SPRY domain-containing protein n=1 Tax=Podarcis muralis TaxID=64176 RepID=A0A670HMA7_PODMU